MPRTAATRAPASAAVRWASASCSMRRWTVSYGRSLTHVRSRTDRQSCSSMFSERSCTVRTRISIGGAPAISTA